jgi:hypothetical protein
MHEADLNAGLGEISGRRLVVAAACVVFPIILFVSGILGGYFIFGKDKMWEFTTANFNVVLGVPMAVIASLAVIVILVTTTPKERLTIKILHVFELSGPSVPIVLWISVFIAIMFGVHWMSKPSFTDGYDKNSSAVHQFVLETS